MVTPPWVTLEHNWGGIVTEQFTRHVDPGLASAAAWGRPLCVLWQPGSIGAEVVRQLTEPQPVWFIDQYVICTRVGESGPATDFAVVAEVADIRALEQQNGLWVNALVFAGDESDTALVGEVEALATRVGAALVLAPGLTEATALTAWFTSLLENLIDELSHRRSAAPSSGREVEAELSFGNEDEFQEDADPEPEPEAEPGPGSPRVLEAAISRADTAAPQAFRAGTSHTIALRVGDGTGALVARTTDGELAAIDSEDLTEGAAAEIAVWAIGGAVQRRGVQIGRSRMSTTASFEVLVPAGVLEFTLQVALILNGRVAQSGVIRGPVTPTGRAARRAGAYPIEFLVGPELADLGALNDSAATSTLTLIEDAAAVHQFAPPAAASAEALFDRPINSIEIQRFADHFDDAIKKLLDAQSFSQQSGWLTSKTKGARTFAELARLGHTAYLALVDEFANTDPARLRAVTNSRLIHLAVFDAVEGRMALELFYDRERPDLDGGWCAGFETALDTGTCPVCPPWDPDTTVASPVPVCPAGFWGVRKSIERVPHPAPTEAAPAELSNHSIAREVPLTSLGNLCIGVSDRADAGAAPAPTAAMATAIAATLGAREVSLVRDWQTWQAEVRDHSPELLILLTHTEKESLELGAGQLIDRDLIKNGFVRTPFSPAAPGPVVLLLGCDTATASGLGSFVQTFRNRGASVVVGTIGQTLGRFAAPIAGDLVALFTADAGPESVGETLTALRRTTLKKGWVTGLLLTAFSDASYRLTRSG